MKNECKKENSDGSSAVEDGVSIKARA